MKFRKLLFGLPLMAASLLPHGHHHVDVQDDAVLHKLTHGEDGRKNQFGPATMALLDTIAFAEGTAYRPNNGYNTQFTGRQFSGVNHPRQILGSVVIVLMLLVVISFSAPPGTVWEVEQ